MGESEEEAGVGGGGRAETREGDDWDTGTCGLSDWDRDLCIDAWIEWLCMKRAWSGSS